MTADNLMLLLRAKSAEGRAEEAAAQRDRLSAAAHEGRDPWLTQVPALHHHCCPHTSCSADAERRGARGGGGLPYGMQLIIALACV